MIRGRGAQGGMIGVMVAVMVVSCLLDISPTPADARVSKRRMEVGLVWIARSHGRPVQLTC